MHRAGPCNGAAVRVHVESCRGRFQASAATQKQGSDLQRKRH